MPRRAGGDAAGGGALPPAGPPPSRQRRAGAALWSNAGQILVVKFGSNPCGQIRIKSVWSISDIRSNLTTASAFDHNKACGRI